MEPKRFWDIIGAACQPGASQEVWRRSLVEALSSLPLTELVSFDRTFDDLTITANTVHLLGAAYLINGSASDDGFYYFRCWLVGMGQRVYEAALANPDNLADTDINNEDYAEAEIYRCGLRAWELKGGQEPEYYALYDRLEGLGDCERAYLLGEDWDVTDREQLRWHLPRLAQLYLADED